MVLESHCLRCSHCAINVHCGIHDELICLSKKNVEDTTTPRQDLQYLSSISKSSVQDFGKLEVLWYWMLFKKRPFLFTKFPDVWFSLGGGVGFCGWALKNALEDLSPGMHAMRLRLMLCYWKTLPKFSFSSCHFIDFIFRDSNVCSLCGYFKGLLILAKGSDYSSTWPPYAISWLAEN